MKRTLAVSLLFLAVSTLATADVTRDGFVVESREFPRVVDLDGNGLDDLVHDRYALLNQGGGTFVKTDLCLSTTKFEYVVDWLDFNGDGRVDLLTMEDRKST